MLFLIGLHGAYSFRPDERKADEYRNVYPYAVPDSDGVPYTKNKKKTYGKEGTHGGV
jgi:hypothetical protein